jgi:3-oxoacyl-[acyl-carrier-protein] synthase II
VTALGAAGATRALAPGELVPTAMTALTAWAVHVPPTALRPALSLRSDREADEIVPAERASELLGRKGLLAKEPATRLALCAVHRALGRPPRAPRLEGRPDPRTAVIACSDFGNAGTVAAVARTVRDEGARAVSPLEAPNASSNVIASTVAIWFRFGGPNLMVCSGATSGLDAIRLARLLIAARRADRVVVVGAEPDDDVVRALRAGSPRPVRAGAAAVVLERGGGVGQVAAAIGPITATAPGPPPAPAAARCVVGPFAVAGRGAVHDLEHAVGDLGAALGVVQTAIATDLALARAPGSGDGVTVLCGTSTDGWRHATVSTPPAWRQEGR